MSSERGAQTTDWLVRLFAALTMLTALRLLALKYSTVELFVDEAQYWDWSRHLSWGYFSKPPGIAFIISSARAVCGDAEWCIRAPSPILYLGSSLAVYFIGRLLYDERTGFWSALMFATTTGVVFSSRIISTDVPLLFCWAVALLAYLQLLIAPSMVWALALGVFLGLGSLSKYAMLYFFFGICLSALVSDKARLFLRSRFFWLALMIALLLLLPNLIWNGANSFSTFDHTANLVVGERVQPSLMRMLSFLAAQFAVFGPITFAMMLAAPTIFAYSSRLSWQDQILVAFFVPPILLMAIISLGVHANENWAATSLVAGIVSATALLLRIDQKKWLIASVCLGILTQLVFIFADANAASIFLPGRAQGNPYDRTMGWRAYAEGVGAVATRYGIGTIASDTRGEVASLRYYLRDQPTDILTWDTQGRSSFDLSHPLESPVKQPLLFVTKCADPGRLQPFFGKVESLGRIWTQTGTVRPRGFDAFILGDAKSAVAPISPCPPRT